MDIYSLLNANCGKLLQQYHSNLEAVLSLQATLINDILPDVKLDLNLDAEATEWAKDWLQDTSSVFQSFRRHNFTRSFAIESIRKNLVWRLTCLRPQLLHLPLRRVLWLPHPDPFGRPIVVLKVSALRASMDELKRLLMPAMDHLRAHLKSLNGAQGSGHTSRPILQYVVLLDLKGLSLQSISVDLISWTLREAIPRFPGMLAAVFIINHSWAHSGIWGVAKCALPATALSRVFFSSQEQLLEYFPPAVLPEEYGGTLLSLEGAEASSNDHDLSPLLNSTDVTPIHPPSTTLIPTPSPPTSPDAFSSISSMSLLNPFFGYPISSSLTSSNTHVFPHGRRRKRDLLRTLVLLWWARWRNHISVVLWFILAMLAVRLAIRKWLLGSRRLPVWRAMWRLAGW